ncbi:hypothetical protein, partial [Campylobacter concisus]|uniref:hypothetical protein n=1 Tax=Campylobacter concisus TaxID=199 RepID=UPI001CA50D89
MQYDFFLHFCTQNEFIMTEHELLKARWEEVVQRLSDTFTEGETLGVDGIIYLIGVQELGQLG